MEKKIVILSKNIIIISNSEVLNQTDKALNNKNKINTNNLKDREREILEKRSQILRLYLVENVIPILSEGILKISHSLPDDPIEELAKFLELKAKEMDVKNEEQKSENK